MSNIAARIKSSKVLYNLYFYTLSILLKAVGVFVKTDENLILFNSFGGKRYDDSPRAIYELMRKDARFINSKLVWAFHDPSNCKVPDETIVVKSDTLGYFLTALAAKIWITNSSMERGLDFKKKNTVCFNTWHGTPIKKMGVDISDDNQSFRSKINIRADIILAQGQYDVDIFSHAFELPKSSFKVIGLPRNDILARFTENDTLRIRKKLGIAEDKIVLLYAPTFREYTRGKDQSIELRLPINPEVWLKELGAGFVVLFRAHYEVASYFDFQHHDQFIDVSRYQDLNDLLIVSDALISDYSSIFFDYSIMEKPMYCFAFDYDEYLKNRGLYIDIEKDFPCVVHRTEDSLLKEIHDFQKNYNQNVDKVKTFRNRYVTSYGNAAKKSCDILAKVLRS